MDKKRMKIIQLYFSLFFVLSINAYAQKETYNGLEKLELPKNRAFTLPPASNKLFFVESVAVTKHANGVDY